MGKGYDQPIWICSLQMQPGLSAFLHRIVLFVAVVHVQVSRAPFAAIASAICSWRNVQSILQQSHYSAIYLLNLMFCFVVCVNGHTTCPDSNAVLGLSSEQAMLIFESSQAETLKATVKDGHNGMPCLPFDWKHKQALLSCDTIWWHTWLHSAS